MSNDSSNTSLSDIWKQLSPKLEASKVDLSSNSTVANNDGSFNYGVVNVLAEKNGGTGSSSLSEITVGKATSDELGNVITDTYATKEEVTAAINKAITKVTDGDGNMVIRSPESEQWTVNIAQSDHQTISYETSSSVINKDGKISSNLYIEPKIKAKEGYEPGVLHKNTDITNHIMNLSADPATALSDIIDDGVLLVYWNTNNNSYYTKMTITHNDSTNTDSYNFKNKVDISNVDTPIRIIGGSPNLVKFTNNFFPYSYSIKGFENSITTSWNNESNSCPFDGNNNINYNTEYINMPNITSIEYGDGGRLDGNIVTNIPFLKSVNFENLEYYNSKLWISHGTEWCYANFCSNCGGGTHVFTTINFPNFKEAYCNFLENYGGAKLNLPSLKIVSRLTNLPNVTDVSMPLLERVERGELLCNCSSLESITLPSLKEANSDILCYCSKLKSVHLPSLTKCQGKLLYLSLTVETIQLDSIENLPDHFLDYGYHVSWSDNDTLIASVSSLRSVVLPNAKVSAGNFLCNQAKSANLTTLSLPNFETANGDFLTLCTKLSTIDLPKLKTVAGNFFWCIGPSIESAEFPSLESVGKEFCISNSSNTSFKTLTVPKLKSVGNFIWNINGITNLDLPSLETINGYFIAGSNNTRSKIKTINAPELKTITGNLLVIPTDIVNLDLPNLTTVGGYICDSDDNSSKMQEHLISVNLPKLETVGASLFWGQNKLYNLTKLSFPALKSVGKGFCSDMPYLEKIECPLLETIGTHCCYNDPKLKEFVAPKLTTIGNHFLNYNVSSLTNIEAPLLEKIGEDFLYGDNSHIITKISLPSLKTIGGGFINHNSPISEIDLPKLTTVGGNLIHNCTQLTDLNLPSLKSVGGALFERYNQPNLTTIELPNLETVGEICICNQNSKTLKEVSLPKLTSTGNDCLARCPYLKKINVPLLKSTGSIGSHNYAMKYFNAPALERATWIFDDSTLIYADFGALKSVSNGFISNTSSIKTIIIRSTIVPYVGGDLCNTKPSDCILYVPDNMISKYLADSKWSVAFDSDHIKSISEAPNPPTE